MAFAPFLHLQFAAFDKPVVATGFFKAFHKDVCHAKHVFHITLGVCFHVGAHGALSPVGLLVFLAEGNAEEVFYQGSQAELSEAEQAGCNLGVEDEVG